MAQIYCREDELRKLNKRYENLRITGGVLHYINRVA